MQEMTKWVVDMIILMQRDLIATNISNNNIWKLQFVRYIFVYLDAVWDFKQFAFSEHRLHS